MKRNRGESGTALLLVFVMAAAIAITLYMEVPRIAFESQRNREQMAIDRGLQYQRAIQLFYRKYHTYPQSLDDLETSRNIRFLRHRYLDPLTGKDWRLLHVGPAGQLTDSLIQPPAPLPGSTTGSGLNSAQGSTQTASPFSQTTSAFSQTANSSQNAGASQSGSVQQNASGQSYDPNNPNDPNAPPPDPLNMALRRPSDRIIGRGGLGVPGGVVNGEPAAEQPEPVQQPFPGQPVQQPTDPNQPSVPGQPQDPALPVIPGEQIPGQPVVPQDPSQSAQPPTNPNQISPTPPIPTPGLPQTTGQTPGFFPAGQPIGGPPPGAAGQQQSAANLIQQILTTPRQPPASIAGFTSGNTGGIAGVASTAEGKGIHVINDHAKYKEWEFVYDLKKDKTVVGAGAVNQQQQVQQQMQQNQGGLGGISSGSSSGSSPFSSTPTTSSNTTPAAPSVPSTAPPSQ